MTVYIQNDPYTWKKMMVKNDITSYVALWSSERGVEWGMRVCDGVSWWKEGTRRGDHSVELRSNRFVYSYRMPARTPNQPPATAVTSVTAQASITGEYCEKGAAAEHVEHVHANQTEA